MKTSLIAVLALATFGGAVAPARSATPEQPRLESGDHVPPFDTLGVDGQPHKVAFHAGRATVLLFFLSSCSVCHRMIPIWNAAYPRRGDKVDIVGVVVDDPPPGFFEIMPVAFPVVRSPGRELLERYKVFKVPMTVRVGADGVVEDVGHGLLDPIRLGELFANPTTASGD